MIYSEEFEEKYADVNPFYIRRKIDKATHTYTPSEDGIGTVVNIREMTPEEEMEYAAAGEKIDWFIAQREIYVAEHILRELGYEECGRYVYGFGCKDEVKEWYEKVHPCGYDVDCSIFCPDFVRCMQR